jgi:hypothetical protein
VSVSGTVSASDPGNASMPTVTLLSVSSSEPDNGLEEGDTVGDIQGWTVGMADTSGPLRPERAGGGLGRVYPFTYRATDAAGNSTTAPHLSRWLGHISWVVGPGADGRE